jgi:hypothetical protein
MADEHREKRRFPRIPAEYAVLVKKLGAAEVEEFAKTRTVGLGGCMVVSDTPLGLGSGVELLISVRGGVVKAHGRVVYEIPKDEGAYQVGVEFLRMSTGDLKLLQALFEGLPEDAEA